MFVYKDIDSLRYALLTKMNTNENKRQRLQTLVSANARLKSMTESERRNVKRELLDQGGIGRIREQMTAIGLVNNEFHNIIESSINEDEPWKLEYIPGKGYVRVTSTVKG